MESGFEEVWCCCGGIVGIVDEEGVGSDACVVLWRSVCSNFQVVEFSFVLNSKGGSWFKDCLYWYYYLSRASITSSSRNFA